MKEIKLISLELTNFKCHAHLKIDFNGRNVSLLGDNGTGKTSVYDAFMWLLFSRDSKNNGEKSIEVKPLGEGGEVKDHNAQTAVDVVLSVNGEEITLRRTLQEVWTTRRGCSELVYTGNVSDYYINSVPVKKNVFSDKVNEIVDEDTFRLLTNVSYFAADMTWQERREVLFRVAGVMDDGQIMATDDRFKPLIDGMGRLSLDDYKKKLLAEKKGFTGAKTEIPARISECQKTIEDVQGLDFAGARANVELLTAQKNGIEAQIVAIEHDSAADRKRLEIREADIELRGLESENKAYRASQTAGAPDVVGIRANIVRFQTHLTTKNRQIANESAYITQLDKDIATSRERWIAVNKETFVGGSCPTCGQALPAKQLETARDAFEANKKARLAEIEQTAADKKEAKEVAEDRLLQMQSDATVIEGDILALEKALAAAEASVIEPVDMVGYAEKRKAAEDKINALNGELADIMANSSTVRAELQKQVAEIRGMIAEQMEIISKESLLEYSRKRVEELREDARNAAQCLEAVESVLFLIDEYSRYKTKFVEDSINGMFRIARFRLFREQANGGIEDRCDVVCNGVPYINLNNGAKINIGIDIINTLSVAYGMSVPLFIDNAESVTKLEHYNNQIIRLVVSEESEKELRVSYEN